MTTSNIKEIIDCDVHKVWKTILAVDKYSQWRSDLSKTEVINEKQFVEYTKETCLSHPAVSVILSV